MCLTGEETPIAGLWMISLTERTVWVADHPWGNQLPGASEQHFPVDGGGSDPAARGTRALAADGAGSMNVRHR